MYCQIIGLLLNLIGTILFGCGALDRSSKTWADIGNISKKAKCILILAYLGVMMIVIGFGLQIIAVYSSNS